MRYNISEAAMTEFLLLLRVLLPASNRCPTFKQAKQYLLSRSLQPGLSVLLPLLDLFASREDPCMRQRMRCVCI